MKLLKKVLPFLLTVCCVLSFAGCGNTEDAVSDQAPAPALQISSLLTREEVYTATGFSVGEPMDFADGGVNYYSPDGNSSVYIGCREVTSDGFDALTANFTNNGMTLTEAPALGEKALWCEEALELLVYADGYALDLVVEYGSSRPNDSLLAARHLAALLLEDL